MPTAPVFAFAICLMSAICVAIVWLFWHHDCALRRDEARDLEIFREYQAGVAEGKTDLKYLQEYTAKLERRLP